MIYSGKHNCIWLIIAFIINPFLSVVYIFNRIAKGGYNKCYPILVSMFFGLLAITQYAPNADINRSYHMMLALGNYNIQELSLFLVADKYKIYTIVNYIIYQLTGNVQLSSLLWGGCIYYLIFLSFENLKRYYNDNSSKNNILYYSSAIFCFVFFVEVMETMKQAVGFSMFLYSLTLFLNDKYKKCLLILCLSAGIHMSQFLLLPLFLCTKLKPNFVIILMILSFSFRTFNLMSLVNSAASLVGLDILAELSSSYIDQNYNNFISDAPYFVLTYVVVALFALFYIITMKNNDFVVTNIVMLYIVVLNLNYSNNHNYTRILLHSYPYWIMILFSIKNLMKSKRMKSYIIGSMVIWTFFLQFWFSYGRIGINVDKYQTSFMGNSIVSILTSSSYSYLNYKVPIN